MQAQIGLASSELAGRTVKEKIRARHKVQRQAELNPLWKTHALSGKVQLENQDHGEKGLVIGI